VVHDDLDEELLNIDDEPAYADPLPKNNLLTAENRPKPLSPRGTMPRMDLKNALKELEAAGSEPTRKTYARHGVKSPMYGVNYSTFTKLKKQIKSDHALARLLWATGNHDARILATMIAVPSQMNEAELESWVAALDNYVLTDAVAKVAAASAYAMKKMQQWTRSTDEWTSSAGWSILGVMTTDRSLADSFFDPYLTRIEKEIHEAPNRTRYAMNGAVIAIGCRGGAAMSKAVTVAKRIGPVDVDHGETGCETPEAVSYIKKVLDHQAGKGGKPSVKAAAKVQGKTVAKSKTAPPKSRTASTAKKKTTKARRLPARAS
jgi:3-methyladenine DNA glycosylase AlkD